MEPERFVRAIHAINTIVSLVYMSVDEIAQMEEARAFGDKNVLFEIDACTFGVKYRLFKLSHAPSRYYTKFGVEDIVNALQVNIDPSSELYVVRYDGIGPVSMPTGEKITGALMDDGWRARRGDVYYI